ncbi:hypothetical protein BSKO_09711 [Bryopsis sp. KO-2023]|nr:hypothetical protein BSKO_09711 [Bryopsis sp. KO-2023]
MASKTVVSLLLAVLFAGVLSEFAFAAEQVATESAKASIAGGPFRFRARRLQGVSAKFGTGIFPTLTYDFDSAPGQTPLMALVIAFAMPFALGTLWG